MPGLAVNVAVMHENKILLTRREDFETMKFQVHFL
jgi:hypothetical protein